MNARWSTIADDNLESLDKAVSFLQEEYGPPGSQPFWTVEYFRWKLGKENPAGGGYLSLAIVSDAVVGVVSLTRKKLLINGKTVIGGEVGDAYTSAKMRRKMQPEHLSSLDADPESFLNRSIFGRLASDVRARAEAGGISVIYGTPNSNAYPGWTKRLGYFDHKECRNQSFSRPTWRMVLKKYPNLTLISGALKAVDSTWILVHAWLWRRLQSDLDFDQSVPEDREIEALWHRTKPSTGFSLVRDAEYWNYRYKQHPSFRYVLFGVRRHKVLVSLVVIRLDFSDKTRRVLLVVEWMSEKGIKFGYLLSQILRIFRNESIDVMNLWANSSGAEAGAARASLFSSRAMVPVILADTKEGRDIARVGEEFLFYLGSTDAV